MATTKPGTVDTGKVTEAAGKKAEETLAVATAVATPSAPTVPEGEAGAGDTQEGSVQKGKDHTGHAGTALVVVLVAIALRYLYLYSSMPTLVPIPIPFKIASGAYKGTTSHHMILEADGDIVVRAGEAPSEFPMTEYWRSGTSQGSACKKCTVAAAKDGVLTLKQGGKVLASFSPAEITRLSKILDVPTNVTTSS